jgi:hypothetical protein
MYRYVARYAGSYVLVLALVWAAALPAFAGTTGTLTGTVRGDGGQPLSGVRVTATAPTGSSTATTDARGFYALQALTPDTYTVSFELAGYEPFAATGTTIQQDLVSRLNETLKRSVLRQIASVGARGAGSLYKPYTGTDVYNVSGAQLNAATGGDNLHKTVYQYLETVPGVTPIGGAYPAEPSIRGGYDVDNGT